MHLISPILAQAADNAAAAGIGAAIAATSMAVVLISVVLNVLLLVARWKVNSKAGQPGWACLIPIYNFYVELRVAGMSPLWLLTLLACGVGYVIPWIICQIKTAQRFGKDIGFGIGLIFLNLIFLMILAFGSAQYVAEDKAQA